MTHRTDRSSTSPTSPAAAQQPSRRAASLLALAAALGLVLGVAPDARALATLDDVRCACADGALTEGDFVSCVARLSRRLVAAGSIDQAARSEAISEASGIDYEALASTCTITRPEIELHGWGAGIWLDSAFHEHAGLVPAVATGRLMLWNFSPVDVMQRLRSLGEEGCLFIFELRDAADQVVRSQRAACLAATGAFPAPVGTVHERDVAVPLAYLDSETGDPDDALLPPGIYRLRGTWLAEGPDTPLSAGFEGATPSATITLRIR